MPHNDLADIHAVQGDLPRNIGQLDWERSSLFLKQERLGELGLPSVSTSSRASSVTWNINSKVGVREPLPP